MDVESVGRVRPAGYVGTPRTGLAAAGAEQLPRGGLRGGSRSSGELDHTDHTSSSRVCISS